MAQRLEISQHQILKNQSIVDEIQTQKRLLRFMLHY